MSLWQALASPEPLLMDAAMGTALLPLGLRCVAEANLSHAREVRAVHAAHAAAGAKVVLTNTFQANPVALAGHGLEDRLEAICRRAVELARLGAPGCLVLGDVGPILSPGGGREFADRRALARTLAALEGVDGILFETCSSPAALAAVEYALHRVAEVEGLPLLLSLAYRRDPAGRPATFSGHAPEVYARHAARHGVAALGVNCGQDIGVPELAEVLRRYRGETDLPLFVRPNAGTPVGGAYPRSPEDLARGVPALLAAGATMIGGCCGTTAAHTAAMAGELKDTDVAKKARQG
jgi:5-methyltetrahydrofolate--homocysteine methyltransferase